MFLCKNDKNNNIVIVTFYNVKLPLHDSFMIKRILSLKM